MQAKKVQRLFEILSAANPAPKTELLHASPYELLVAVVLSAQATDKGVNKITPALFKAANTPKKMVALGLERVTELVKSINLYKTKAKHIVELSEMLIEDFGGKVPDRFDDLLKLPGVGRKTANVVLNAAFGVPTIAVDTHIFRVANRTGLAPGKTPREVEEGLMKIVPEKYRENAHHWLLLHGRYVCTARKPHCETCAIAECCEKHL